MNILALETTGIVCGAAMHDGLCVIAEVHTREARVHDRILHSQIGEVCLLSGIPLNKVHAVACSIGPGSFTGIRIGLAMAKGLCMTLGISLVPVPTLDALAYAAREDAWRLGAAGIISVVNAGSGKLYWCRYSADGFRLG
jgi:tRNA threonylcarbamoyladenosine biosynthesis protein TsaB